MERLQLLSFVIVLFIGISLSAQEVVEVERSNDVSKKISYNSQYLLDDFYSSKAYFKDGKIVDNVFMNYNMLLDEMHFITPDEKIQKIANPNDLMFIYLGKRLFIYNRGYLEIIGNFPVKLAVRRRLKSKGSARTGAYGSKLDTESSDAITSLQVDERAHTTVSDLEVKELRTYDKDFSYFLYHNDRLTRIRNPRSFSRVFSVDDNFVNGLINSKNLSLENEEDLLILVQKCNEESKKR